jgi:hypothetical protein
MGGHGARFCTPACATRLAGSTKRRSVAVSLRYIAVGRPGVAQE